MTRKSNIHLRLIPPQRNCPHCWLKRRIYLFSLYQFRMQWILSKSIFPQSGFRFHFRKWKILVPMYTSSCIIVNQILVFLPSPRYLWNQIKSWNLAFRPPFLFSSFCATLVKLSFIPAYKRKCATYFLIKLFGSTSDASKKDEKTCQIEFSVKS